MQATLEIPGYDSFEQIALGGVATVYRARKTSIKKPVAIKVLFPHLAADERFIDRFQKEAEVAARLQHDNIVGVIDYGESAGQYYIVMEYYDGIALDTLQKRFPVLAIDASLAMMIQACNGLEAAHAARLVHRDIKPANMILTHQGGLKIADFGLARDSEALTRTSQEGKIVGTPAYMSPEQTRGDTVTLQSDLFSLGVVAYEMLTGERPFGGSHYAEVVEGIQNLDPVLISSRNPLVDRAFEAVVVKLLEKSAADRYMDAGEVVRDLESAMQRYGYRWDARGLTDFYNDPVAYNARFRADLLERLRGRTPSENADTEQLQRYYRKLVHLDPDNEDARAQLSRLVRAAERRESGAEEPIEAETAVETDAPTISGLDLDPALDPDAEYAVYLEGIDRYQETAESFALKLSMRIKMPLPRAKGLVRGAPTRIAGHLPMKKAKKLLAVLKGLGGEARLEMEAAAAPRREPDPEPTPDPQRKPHRPGALPQDRERGPAGELDYQPEGRPGEYQICAKCGWEEAWDARFCSVCRHPFDRTETLDAASLKRKQHAMRGGGEGGTPGAAQGLQRYVDLVRSLPRNIKIAGAAFILLILITIFTR